MVLYKLHGLVRRSQGDVDVARIENLISRLLAGWDHADNKEINKGLQPPPSCSIQEGFSINAGLASLMVPNLKPSEAGAFESWDQLR